MATCRYCGAEIKYVRRVKGWLHAAPLAQYRVTHWEVMDIRLNRPPRNEPLNRGTLLHPAQPERS